MLIYKKPVTSSQRFAILINNKLLNKNKPIKKLTKGSKKKNGRNNQGKITVKHRGGGHKKLFRKINFERNLSFKGIVQSIEYDPNRTANIAKILTEDHQIFYILSSENLKKGDIVENNHNTKISEGNSLFLRNVPLGSLVYNISLYKNKKGQLCRSAGTFGQLLQKVGKDYCNIRLPSGEQRLIYSNAIASLGITSNVFHKNIKLGKAGRKRWKGFRPKVRGVAMNPVDHPHGGGEGKTSGGRPSVSFKGEPTKGKPTRKSKKLQNFILKFRK